MANGLGGTIHDLDLFVRLSGLGLVLSAYLLKKRAGYFCIMLIQIETPSFQSFPRGTLRYYCAFSCSSVKGSPVQGVSE